MDVAVDGDVVVDGDVAVDGDMTVISVSPGKESSTQFVIHF